MAEERLDNRETTWRQLLPWTELFRGFEVALDHNKLLLAAAGILVMAFGWWLLSAGFAANESGTPPSWPGRRPTTDQEYLEFRADRLHWNLMNEAAGLSRGENPPRLEVEDIAETLPEYDLFKSLNDRTFISSTQAEQAYLTLLDQLEVVKKKEKVDKSDKVEAEAPVLSPEEARKFRAKAGQYARLGQIKPTGRLMTWPWFEDRGPNPYLLVTGQTGVPWEAGHFWEWFLRDQVLVMIEPLVKFIRPVIYFFSPRNDFSSRCYFFLVTLWTLLTWSVFGGAITRIAVVQVARGEKIGLLSALRFTFRRIVAYLTAPLFPILGVAILTVVLALFGVIHLIPYVGDVFDGVFWGFLLVCGFLMAIILVGLIGWPLMIVTISAQSTDSWEAASRAYQYVYQRAWHFAWYSVVAICYGAVLVFVVGVLGSLSVYLTKWGVSQAPGVQYFGREPSFLFVYAPTSFGWRELLLEGSQTTSGKSVVQERGARNTTGSQVGGVSRWNRIDPANYNEYVSQMSPNRKIGAALVAFWLDLAFLLILGFGYAYFWGACTIIYLLLRRNLDTDELDEIYQDDDDYEGHYPGSATGTPAPATHAPATPPRATSLPVVGGGGPSLAPRPPAPVAPAPPVAHAPLPATPSINASPGPAPVSAPAPVIAPPVSNPIPVPPPAPAPAFNTPAPAVAPPAPVPKSSGTGGAPDIIVFTPGGGDGNGENPPKGG